ncbi:hypothetical protein ZIOFF_073229 [Zingiber officinale]|uniref:Pentatricopeptide repeat-containing protein n=1 Tax=Zingiber officinale TaxID=94328 RepID=A0A8J5EP47_ZINOF|nr:hypothetical protein ZIOFF_073229 [Zingiber officinale]
MASRAKARNEALFIQGVCAIASKGSWRTLSSPHITTRLSSSVHRILLHLSLDSALSWRFFNWAALSLPHYRHSLSTNFAMVRILTNARRFQEARDLLEKFAFKQLVSSPSVLGSFLSTHDDDDDKDSDSQIVSWLVFIHARSNKIQDALQLFDEMKKRRLKPDPHACSALLSALAKARLTATAWNVYEALRSLRAVPNLYIFNVMIHVCYKSGDNEKADKLLLEMERKAVPPDLFTYNTLISLYCKKAMHYEALAIQDRMEKKGIHPDIVTYNSLIHGFCKEGRMREASKLFKEIKHAIPNQVTYTTLIDGYCRMNDLNEALRLREEMEAKGMNPGVATYNAIIRKLCTEGKLKAVNDLLNEMDDRKVQPDNFTCNTLINAYCKRGNMDFAWKLRNKMLESGLALDQFTYKALIHGFCKVQQLDEAKEVVLDMLEAGPTPKFFGIIHHRIPQHKFKIHLTTNSPDPPLSFKNQLLPEISVSVRVWFQNLESKIPALQKFQKSDTRQQTFQIQIQNSVLDLKLQQNPQGSKLQQFGKAIRFKDIQSCHSGLKFNEAFGHSPSKMT